MKSIKVWTNTSIIIKCSSGKHGLLATVRCNNIDKENLNTQIAQGKDLFGTVKVGNVYTTQ